MNGSRFTYKGDDLRDISGIKWIPDENVKVQGVVQIIHGMAEHLERYEEFALYLNKKGFIVIGNDLRGHGKSLEKEGETGIFSENNGWNLTLGDIRRITLQIQEQHKGLPIFIVAHSIGSFLARTYIAHWGKDLSGVILLGTGHKSVFVVRILKLLVYIEILFRGKRHRSKFFDHLSFGSFNKTFGPHARSEFEWLSRDPHEVDEYVKDPLCGFVCTTVFYRDFADGLIKACSRSIYKKIPKDLPMFLYSGDCDPVGGKGGVLVKKVHSQLLINGIRDLTLNFNREGRHESINETNRHVIYGLLEKWIKGHL